MRNTFVRLIVEAMFIILVLVIARLADLSAGWIILCGAVAWLLTAIAEGYVSRGWQGAATFVPPVRPFAHPREYREPAPVWETTVTPPEQVAPAWLETAEVLGVHVAGFEPASEAASEPVESIEPEVEEVARDSEKVLEEEEAAAVAEAEAVPADEDLIPVAEEAEEPEEPEEELAVPDEPAAEEEAVTPPPPVRRPGRSRLPRRFVTQSRPARPAPAPIDVSASAEEPAPAARGTVDDSEAMQPEPKPWPPADRRWPWRRPRGEQEPERGPAERGPASERRAGQPELPLFGVPERPCRSCGQPISKERLRAIPNATQCIDCKRAGRPELADIPDFDLAPELEAEAPAVEAQVPHVQTAEDVEVEREVATVAPDPEPVSVDAQPVETPPPVEHRAFPDSAREWNVWELERLARRLGGRDTARDEEWAFLLVYLREFANPEGSLPADFDALVRESFPELVAVAETT